MPDEARRRFARLALGQPVCGEAAQARRVLHVADIQEGDASGCAGLAALGVRAYVAYPLLAGDRLLGTLSFGTRARDRFPEEDLAFLGAIAHHVAVVRERLRAEAALRGSEARWRGLFERMHEGFALCEMVYGPDGEAVDYRHLELNDAWARLTGVPKERVQGKLVSEAVPGIEPFWLETYARVVETGEPAHFEHHLATYGRWFEVMAYRTEPGRFAALFLDATGRKRDEERRALLVAELNHRVKNTLAVVQSLALQTARGAPDPAAFSKAFQARLVALARAHDLLTRESWKGAPLSAVARAALEACGGQARADLTACPSDALLPPAQGLALAMALHELATNALKHGALSVPAGRVSVACRAAAPADGGWIVEWAERGGPPVPALPPRRGFGLRLLERGLASQAGMAADLRFEPGGVRCVLRLPPPSSAAVPAAEEA